MVSAFYENVSRHKAESRELAPGEKDESVVLEFRPSEPQDMLVACLWSHWRGRNNEPDLLSFVVITDDRRRKSRLPATTDASFRSSPTTSMRGSARTRKTSPPCTRSSTTASAPITNIGSPRRRRPLSSRPSKRHAPARIPAVSRMAACDAWSPLIAADRLPR